MRNKKNHFSLIILAIFITPIYAAKPVNLRNESKLLSTFLQTSLSSTRKSVVMPAAAGIQSPNLLRGNFATSLAASNPQQPPVKNDSDGDVKQTSVNKDFNNVKHIRIHQTFAGLPIWGADAILHLKNGTTTSNGIFYQDLQNDLKNTPNIVFTSQQKEHAIDAALRLFQQQHAVFDLLAKNCELVVYIDKANKAHYAFHISFYGKTNGSPVNPHYLLDAINFNSYLSWNNIKHLTSVLGGGFGGNLKIGKLVYDGLQGHLPKLQIEREDATRMCFLQNKNVRVIDHRINKVARFLCEAFDENHNQVYWDGESDQINGGYSPNHDALYAGIIVEALYKDWYGIPVLIHNNEPLTLEMVTHSPILIDGVSDPDNAYWDSVERRMYFGDGEKQFYPLTSVGIAAHEISHGFTEQHANLFYYDEQSGGLNESFSDMAAQAAEYYVTGSNSWQIALEVSKEKNAALRYMDEPTRDCNGRVAGNDCSIDHVRDVHFGLRVHHSSGVFNRVFYLLATSPNWNTRKAFDVMVKANQDYWTSLTTFQEAACGVLNASLDYRYDVGAVSKAFSAVDINTGECG